MPCASRENARSQREPSLYRQSDVVLGAVQNTAQQIPLFPDDDIVPEQTEPGRMPGFSVRESGRARRLSIKVYPRGRVEVVVPKRTRAAEVASFVAENKDWIRRARESFATHTPPADYSLPQIIHLVAVGRPVRVCYARKSGASSVRYRYANGQLNLSGRTEDRKSCIDAIRRWLAKTAREEFAPQLRSLSRLTGTPYGKLQIRAQRSCWGSRSASGTLSLNLCLLFLDPPLVRYLMIHELCHGRHMNHSLRFWKMVARFEPGYRRLDRALGEGWRQVPAWFGIY